jgi:hypothetical protein
MEHEMKKMFIAAAAISVLAGTGFARAGDGWSVTLEPEHERLKADDGSHFDSDSLAISAAYRSGADKYDLKVETSKDHDAAGAVGGKLEMRYRRYFDKWAGIEPSVRVSLGEATNSGGPDFAFYTVQPKLAYEIGNGWEPYFSIRYRDAFASKYDYFTRTFYLGAAYEVDSAWEIEPSIFHKNGSETSNGVKLEITRSF